MAVRVGVLEGVGVNDGVGVRVGVGVDEGEGVDEDVGLAVGVGVSEGTVGFGGVEVGFAVGETPLVPSGMPDESVTVAVMLGVSCATDISSLPNSQSRISAIRVTSITPISATGSQRIVRRVWARCEGE